MVPLYEKGGMKRLTKIVLGLALLALLFATPAAGEEIIMVCTNLDREYTIRYVDPLVGSLEGCRRRSRGWDDW